MLIHGTYAASGGECDPERLKLLVAAPALGGRELLQSRGCRVLAGVLLRPLPPTSSDPAPVAHQHRAPEQVALDHQGVEARHVPPRLKTAQHQGVADS